MAQRRMFSPDIVCSDAFLDMPVTSRELYFQLGMRADDDGFIPPRGVMRACGSSEDDLKILIAKRFVLPFDNGVIVIKHWRVNNLVRKDWYRPTRYLEEKSLLFVKENGSYTLDSTQGQRLVNGSLTEVRLGKDRLLDAKASEPIREEREKPKERKVTPEMQKVFDLFSFNPARLVWKTRVHEREAAAVLHKEFGVAELKTRLDVSQRYRKDPLCPQIDSPSDLLEKMPKMEKFLSNI